MSSSGYAFRVYKNSISRVFKTCFNKASNHPSCFKLSHQNSIKAGMLRKFNQAIN